MEEALFRLVELNYKIGLVQEAQNYANLLGYNYNSSKWYEESYKILNKNYTITKLSKNDKSDSYLKKFKNLFK